MTRDIDIVIDLEAADSGNLSDQLSAEFYADRDAISRAAVERRIVNVIHLDFRARVP